MLPEALLRRARRIAAAGVAALAAAYVLLGFVPLLAADRQAAKYGVGVYHAGFERGALVYHVALALGGAVLPLMLAIALKRRQPSDVVLCVLLGIGVAVSLSRGETFMGPLVFLVALAVERRWRPLPILAAVCLAFVGGALVNELLYTAPPVAGPSFSSRVAASAPDISDHIGFLNGYELSGSQQTGLKPLTAGFGLRKGYWDPADYALRIRTGLPDVSELASGGLRLPAPIWGYAAYGYVGAAMWSFAAGVFIGWGTMLLRRLLAPVEGVPGQALNLLLARAFFAGTFGVLGNFYFPQRAGLALFAVALALGVSRRRPAAPAPVSAGGERDPVAGQRRLTTR
jgi:hypothetical protein